VDLLEEIAFLAEERYGTGPMKQREVRAAIYYILKGFFGNRGRVRGCQRIDLRIYAAHGRTSQNLYQWR